LAELRERGRARLGELRREIEARVAATAPPDVATIVYTSGTTGPPKGVVQSHGNHLATLEAIEAAGLMRFSDPEEVDFLFLPLAHSFARAAEYLATYAGSTTVFAQSIDTVASDLRETRPTVMAAVPRIFEKLYARVMAQREAAGLFGRLIFDWAVKVGRNKSRRLQRRDPVPPWVELQVRLADLLVFRRIREALGGRIRFLISGGAPLARDIQEFFHAAGILILEGYGLTETTPILTVNRPDRYKFGTVGLPIEGVTLRLAEDGEILAKGPNVALGYFERPEETAAAWDSEGWFHTGDIGELDEDGFLRITDRKKDLIKTSGGKYVAPQKIENLLKTQPHISQAVVIGDNRKYCVALITLDLEEVSRWAAGVGIAVDDPRELARHPRVVELIDKEVQETNRRLASYESIKSFRILPGDFSQETGELTPSLKVKRKVVSQKYADLIEEMYAAGRADSAGAAA
jgi:long-chain acyl-CoA synthetase